MKKRLKASYAFISDDGASRTDVIIGGRVAYTVGRVSDGFVVTQRVSKREHVGRGASARDAAKMCMRIAITSGEDPFECMAPFGISNVELAASIACGSHPVCTLRTLRIISWVWMLSDDEDGLVVATAPIVNETHVPTTEHHSFPLDGNLQVERHGEMINPLDIESRVGRVSSLVEINRDALDEIVRHFKASTEWVKS